MHVLKFGNISYFVADGDSDECLKPSYYKGRLCTCGCSDCPFKNNKEKAVVTESAGKYERGLETIVLVDRKKPGFSGGKTADEMLLDKNTGLVYVVVYKRIEVWRARCSCDKTHSLLPSNVIPYQMASKELVSYLGAKSALEACGDPALESLLPPLEGTVSRNYSAVADFDWNTNSPAYDLEFITKHGKPERKDLSAIQDEAPVES
jgi:hypothetical protein